MAYVTHLLFSMSQLQIIAHSDFYCAKNPLVSLWHCDFPVFCSSGNNLGCYKTAGISDFKLTLTN